MPRARSASTAESRSSGFMISTTSFEVSVDTAHTFDQLGLGRSNYGSLTIIARSSILASRKFFPQLGEASNRGSPTPAASVPRTPIQIATALAHPSAGDLI